MAAISPDYYARIEQGRRSAPWSTLDAIARVLRLDDAGREYLFELSAIDAAPPRHRRAQQVPIHFQRLLNELTEIPALILGHRMDILAWNPLVAALTPTSKASPSGTATTCASRSPIPRCAPSTPTGTRPRDWRRTAAHGGPSRSARPQAG